MKTELKFGEASPGWHYNTLEKSNDELSRIGRINISSVVLDKIEKIISDPIVEGGTKRIHIGTPAESVDHIAINNRISYMKNVGYTTSDYFIEFINDKFVELEDILTNKYNISHHHACAIIIPSGQCMPVHGDTYGYLSEYMKRDYPDVKYDAVKNIKRYLVFLTDWEWGQVLGAGNTISHQWPLGAVYQWKHKMPHWASNSGMKPMVFFEITGLELDR